MFYFLAVTIVFYNVLLYTVFRCAVFDYLRLSGMSKSNIEKNRDGFLNYWFYNTINKKKPLGILYKLNILFLASTLLYSVAVLFFGYINVTEPLILVLSLLICAVEIPSTVLAAYYSNLAEFGRPFVLFAWSKIRNKYASSLIDMFSWVVTLFLICVMFFHT